MSTLPDSLIQKFAKIANEPPRDEKDVIVYGTASISGDGTEEQEINVTLDGSETATPVTSTCVVKDGDRVTVLIKNHKAVITGNITKPSATDVDLQDAKEDIADVATTVSGFSGDIEAASTAAERAARLAQDSLTAANGKSRNFYTADPPDPDDYDYEFQEGDTWYDTDGGYLMHDWNPTTLQWDPKPLDSQAIAVGAIKAANIDAGAITADKVAAKAISVDKLNVGDITNYVLVNENIESSMSTIAGGETVVATQTLYYADTKYVAKKVATNSRLYLVYDNKAINPFRQNEEIFFSFYGKAATSGNVYFRVFAYSEDNVQIANATIEGTGTTIGLTTTDQFFSGVVKFNSVYWNMAAYYRICIEDLRSTKSQVYLRDIKVYKRASADLIVNGTITAEKINGNELVGTSVTGGKLNTTYGQRKRYKYNQYISNFTEYGYEDNSGKFSIEGGAIYDIDEDNDIANLIQPGRAVYESTGNYAFDFLYLGPRVFIPTLYMGGGTVRSYVDTINNLAQGEGGSLTKDDTGIDGVTGYWWGRLGTINLSGFKYQGDLTTPQQIADGRLIPVITQDLYDTNLGVRFYIYGVNDDGQPYPSKTTHGDGKFKFYKRPGMIHCPSLDGQTTKQSIRGTFTYITKTRSRWNSVT